MVKINNWRVIWDRINKNVLTRKNASMLYTIGFFLILLLLIKSNWYLIQNPPEISTLEDIKDTLLTKLNKQLLLIGCLYAICGLLFFLLRLPFLNIEQFKFFGLEYKLQAEKQEAIANETVEKQLLNELTRLSIIEYLTTPVIRSRVAGFLRDYDFNIHEALQLLEKVLKNYYLDMLDVEIETGFVEVDNDQIVQQDEFAKLQLGIQEVVESAIQTKHFEFRQNSFSIAAIPLFVQENIESFTVFFIRTYSGYMILSEADCQMLQIAWSIILDQASLASYEIELVNA